MLFIITKVNHKWPQWFTLSSSSSCPTLPVASSPKSCNTLTHFCWTTSLPTLPHNFTHYRWTGPLAVRQKSSIFWFRGLFWVWVCFRFEEVVFVFIFVCKAGGYSSSYFCVTSVSVSTETVPERIPSHSVLSGFIQNRPSSEAHPGSLHTHTSQDSEPTGRSPGGSRLENKSAANKTPRWIQNSCFLQKIKSLFLGQAWLLPSFFPQKAFTPRKLPLSLMQWVGRTHQGCRLAQTCLHARWSAQARP